MHNNISSERRAEIVVTSLSWLFLGLVYLTGVLSQKTTYIQTTSHDVFLPLDKYGIPSPGSTSLLFRVKACSEVFLTLDSPESDTPLRIVLGDSDHSSAYLYRNLSVWELTYSCSNLVSILSCDEFKGFEVSWGGRQILVKTSIAGTFYIFLSYPLNYSLTNVKVGIAAEGEWEFQVSEPEISTEFTSSPDTAIIITVAIAVAMTFVAVALGVLLWWKVCRRSVRPSALMTTSNDKTKIVAVHENTLNERPYVDTEYEDKEPRHQYSEIRHYLELS